MRTVMAPVHRWNRPPARGRGHRGQSLAEISMMLPFLAVLIAGSVQFGMLFYASITVDAAAREGARLASFQPVSTGAFNGGGTTRSSKVTCRVSGSGSTNPLCAAVWENHGVLGGTFTVDASSIDPVGGPVNTCSGSPSDGYAVIKVSYPTPIFVPFVNTLLSDTGNPGSRTVSDTVIIRVAPCALTNGN